MWRLLLQMLMPMLMNNAASEKTQGPFANPFGNPFQQEDDSDGPINVEAEVMGEDQEVAEKVHQTPSSPLLTGESLFQGSRSYNIAVVVFCILFVLGGVAMRLWLLVSGQIFSYVVVPVAIGAIFGLVVALVFSGILLKKKNENVWYCMADMPMLIFASVLMGYFNLAAFAFAMIVCFLYKRIRKKGKLPLLIPFVIAGVVLFVLFRFPGFF